MGGYDLYGRYYPNANDAINAEMAQCAAIDADIAYREVQNMKRQMLYEQQPSNTDEEIHHLWQYIKELEVKIDKLQEITKHLNP